MYVPYRVHTQATKSSVFFVALFVCFMFCDPNEDKLWQCGAVRLGKFVGWHWHHRPPLTTVRYKFAGKAQNRDNTIDRRVD